jgi:hypothetical protein
VTDQPLTISGEQRDALYEELLDRLTGIDGVWLAIDEENDLEKADQRAREFAGYLRLIFEDLGWGDHGPPLVELTMPPDELSQTISRLRVQAAERYEEERAEQEAFRTRWEHTALVRETCDEVLKRLGASP